MTVAFATNIHVFYWRNCNKFSGPLTFYREPTSPQILTSNILCYDTDVKINTPIHTPQTYLVLSADL